MQISATTELQKLRRVLKQVYFYKKETKYQRKATLWIENDLFLDPIVTIFICGTGSANLEVYEALKDGNGFNDRDSCTTFGRLKIWLIPYNRCGCDKCLLLLHRYDQRMNYQIIVFEDFIFKLSVFGGGSLLQIAVHKLMQSKERVCCGKNNDRPLWLGDMVPTDSACILIPKTLKNLKLITWNELNLAVSYLLINVYRDNLEIHAYEGYNIIIKDFPRGILDYFDSKSTDLCFITHTLSGFIVMFWDKYYKRPLKKKGTNYSLWINDI